MSPGRTVPDIEKAGVVPIRHDSGLEEVSGERFQLRSSSHHLMAIGALIPWVRPAIMGQALMNMNS